MILDQIKNKDLYVKAHPLFEKAFRFIETYLKNPLEPGIYELCGEDLFARIMEYDTMEDAHKPSLNVKESAKVKKIV